MVGSRSDARADIFTSKARANENANREGFIVGLLEGKNADESIARIFVAAKKKSANA
jgi:hypothetical protein